MYVTEDAVDILGDVIYGSTELGYIDGVRVLNACRDVGDLPLSAPSANRDLARGGLRRVEVGGIIIICSAASSLGSGAECNAVTMARNGVVSDCSAFCSLRLASAAKRCRLIASGSAIGAVRRAMTAIGVCVSAYGHASFAVYIYLTAVTDGDAIGGQRITGVAIGDGLVASCLCLDSNRDSSVCR